MKMINACLALTIILLSIFVFILNKDVREMEKQNSVLADCLRGQNESISFILDDMLTRVKIERDNEEKNYDFTENDILLMTHLLCGSKGKDGDGEYDFEYMFTDEGLLPEKHYDEVCKVLEVVMNRVSADKAYADNVHDVIFQRGAFSGIKQGLILDRNDISEKCIGVVRNWCSEYNSGTYVRRVPPDHYWFAGNGIINVTRGKY